VKDAAGKEDTFSFTLVVVDNVAPEITEVTLGGQAVTENGTVTLSMPL